jgi:hypothetical protein
MYSFIKHNNLNVSHLIIMKTDIAIAYKYK